MFSLLLRLYLFVFKFRLSWNRTEQCVVLQFSSVPGTFLNSLPVLLLTARPPYSSLCFYARKTSLCDCLPPILGTIYLSVSIRGQFRVVFLVRGTLQPFKTAN